METTLTMHEKRLLLLRKSGKAATVTSSWFFMLFRENRVCPREVALDLSRILDVPFGKHL